MDAQAALPTLFGRLTAVLNEHQHLGVTTRKLTELRAALKSGQLELSADLRPGPLLEDFERELSQHFSAEEADTHFGAVARERPALLPDVVALKEDHRSMLRSIETLRLAAADEARWVELPEALQQLLDQLRQHELAEARLLGEFFSREEPAIRAP